MLIDSEIKTIYFAGFWPDFNMENNFIINTIRKFCRVKICEKPQYLFVGPFSDDFLNYDCVRIFYTGENLCPDFRVFDYAIGFEYMEYLDRYMRFPNWAIPELYEKNVNLMKCKHLNVGGIDSNLFERGFCSFVVSKGNGYVSEIREQIFRILSEYKKVDSGGRFLNNIGCPDGVEDKLDFQSRYKFAIAAENSSQPGYTTEKIVDAFAANTIPIYWGDPLITKEFNAKAFINLNDYENLEEAVSQIIQIDNSKEKYYEMISEPALLVEHQYMEELYTFLYNIFRQPYSKAFRRDAIGYNKKQEERMKKMCAIENSKIYKIFNRFI